MLIAEIRRKLPSIEDIDANGPDALAQIRGLLRESKEDLLTADVFGVIKYLPRRPYLDSVLGALASRNPDSKVFQDALPQIRERIHNLLFQFWPNYATPAGLSDGSTEPDVQLADDQTFLLFEVKLYSTFGYRQLERELAVAACESKGREFFVVLVTPGSKPPRFRYGAARLQAPEYLAAVALGEELPVEARKILAANRNRVLWISWEAILKSLNEAHQLHRDSAANQSESVSRAADMLGDLNALMLLRHIQPFAGFTEIRDLPTDGQYDARPVFLSAVNIEVRDVYQLSNALRIAPQPFGWRSVSLQAIPQDAFVPVGACCKTWNLSSDKPILRLNRDSIKPKSGWSLAGPLLRWPPPKNRAGFALQKKLGK